MPRPLSFVVFLAVALLVLGGMHYYLWARLVRDTALPEPWRRVATVFVVAAAIGIPLGLIGVRLAHRAFARVVPAAVFVWLGVAFLLFASLIAADVARLFASGAGAFVDALRRAPDMPPDPSRRLFVARAVAGGAALVAGGSAALGVRGALGTPEIHEVPIRLERLPRALSGLTIAQITDLHVGPTIGEREVRRVVEATNALRPDLVAITGDLVDGTVGELSRSISALAGLEARYGVFFVTGNHEYYSGVTAWLRELARLGIRPLRNERVTVGDRNPGGASIDLAGIDDWRSSGMAPGHGPDLERAVAGRDPDRALVLLAHQPKGVGEAVQSGVELQLSGHTHGGQIFPFSLVVRAFYPYLKGLYTHREGDRTGQIYVSPGTGYWGPPMRLGAPAEITKIVLT